MKPTFSNSTLRQRRRGRKNGWPWPRDYWADLLTFLETKAHARAVGFDLFFEDPSKYQDTVGDDERFGEALDKAGIPVIVGQQALKNGRWSRFAPPVARPPHFGAVNVIEETPVRRYVPSVGGLPSLAVTCVLFLFVPLLMTLRSPEATPEPATATA